MSKPTNEELNVATWKIPNALGIIGSSANNEFNGMTASWITQVSMEPLLIAVGIDNKSITHGLMSASEYFSLNLFSENLLYSSNTKLFYMVIIVLITIVAYIFISIITKAFKISDINLKY